MENDILLIGNGFDLAHGLPTRYTDFLDVCKIASKRNITDPSAYSGDCAIFAQFASTISDNNEVFIQFKRLIRHNFWVKYLFERRNVIPDKWIDFENEIYRLAINVHQEMISSNTEDPRLRLPPTFITQYVNTTFGDSKSFTYKDLFEKLVSDQKDLTKALDIYMDYFVNKLKVIPNSKIKKLDIGRVLSFNYTSTYSENYSASDVDCCYIHGMANCTSPDKVNCNLVLGFDDHYLDSSNVISELIPFEKYYQRIINRTDNRYFKWLKDIDITLEPTRLYIFGHSLSPSDGDIIREFVTNPKVLTIIYYKDEIDRAEKVKNLALTIGPNKLIELTGGLDPQIEFVPIAQ